MTMTRVSCSAALALLLFGCAAEETAVAPPAAPPATTSAAPAAASTAASPREAETLVTELYREHDAQRGPFFQTEDRARLDRFFEPSLAELIWKDAVDAKGEVGALGFDPLYDAQDVEPKNLTVQPAQADGAAVRVPVSFESYGEKRQVTYVLARSGNGWKISDIRYDDGRTLRDAYQPPK
jgi:hypothetical protein